VRARTFLRPRRQAKNTRRRIRYFGYFHHTRHTCLRRLRLDTRRRNRVWRPSRTRRRTRRFLPLYTDVTQRRRYNLLWIGTLPSTSSYTLRSMLQTFGQKQGDYPQTARDDWLFPTRSFPSRMSSSKAVLASPRSQTVPRTHKTRTRSILPL
jgi:hypothetical protein